MWKNVQWLLYVIEVVLKKYNFNVNEKNAAAGDSTSYEYYIFIVTFYRHYYIQHDFKCITYTFKVYEIRRFKNVYLYYFYNNIIYKTFIYYECIWLILKINNWKWIFF